MNVEIIRYERINTASDLSLSSINDILQADEKKIIGVIAQIILNYSTFDVKLPESVIKLQRRVLRDFSLLHPVKVTEALDQDAFE